MLGADLEINIFPIDIVKMKEKQLNTCIIISKILFENEKL